MIRLITSVDGNLNRVVQAVVEDILRKWEAGTVLRDWVQAVEHEMGCGSACDFEDAAALRVVKESRDVCAGCFIEHPNKTIECVVVVFL